MKLAYAPIALTATALLLTGCGSGTTWSASVTRYSETDPASLAVAVSVTNTGSKEATPTCTVDASDPSGAYNGVDVGTLTDPVAAGATTTYVADLVITSQGAQYVTDVTAKCS